MDRYLRRYEVMEITSMKDPQMWREERAGRFPQRRRLTDRTVAWLESEVQEWIDSRPTNSGDFPNLIRRGKS